MSQEALESITKLIEDSKTPDSIKAMAFASRGDIYRHNNEATKAIDDYGNAAGLDDKYIDVLRPRSWLNEENNQYTAIVHDISIVIAKLEPQAADYWLRAYAYAMLGKEKEAINDLTAALPLETNAHLLVSIYDRRGHLQALQGNYNEAREDYSAAIRLIEQALRTELPEDQKETFKKQLMAYKMILGSNEYQNQERDGAKE